MAFDIDSDLLRSASHSNMIAHLTAPLQAGAGDSPWPIAADGTIVVSTSRREPMLLIAPLQALAELGMQVSAVLDPDGQALALTPALRFGPYTEAGAYLALYRPPVDPGIRMAAPFKIRLAVQFVNRDGSPAGAPVADVSQVLQVRLLEGVLGSLIWLLGAEKMRLRRQAREIAVMRNLSKAEGDALDRFGADIAVPRFSDQIRFDPVRKEIVTEVRTDAGGNPVAEPDDEYRRRISLYFPMLMPNRRSVMDLLNGPGAPADPNAGPLSKLGIAGRFNLLETTNDFAVAIHIVSSGGDPMRNNFFKYLRDAYLIWPASSPQGDAAHANRFLPSSARTEVVALRTRLRQVFNFAADGAIAPMLADALDRVGRVRLALGLLAKLDVLRAQDPSGSRYELGLGVDLKPPLAAELDQLRAKLIDPNRVAGNDPEVESLLRSLQPVPAAQDPDGEWLFHGCGLPTVHRVDTNTLYVSHFPTFGLVIAQGAATPAVPFPLEARYQAPGDPGSNAVLQAALAGATTQWASAGGEAFSILSDAAARTRWHQPAQPVPAAQTIFLAAGLPAVANLAQVAPQLDALPPELLETIRLGPVLTGQIMAGHPASADTLRTLAGILANQSISSILPLVTAPNEILLVLGVIGLPVAGINLSDRRSTGFRWYIVPLEGPPGQIKTIGSRSAWTPDQPALVAIVVVGYARRGLVDPYEVRVEAPAQGLLNLPQYEFLMNLLEQAYPVGILVNTFALRQGNVDLDGDGHADPLPPALSRTYRRFHRPRHSGEVAVNIAVNP